MSVTKKYRGSMEKVVGDYVRERLAGRTDIDTRRVFLVDTCRTSGLKEAASCSGGGRPLPGDRREPGRLHHLLSLRTGYLRHYFPAQVKRA